MARIPRRAGACVRVCEREERAERERRRSGSDCLTPARPDQSRRGGSAGLPVGGERSPRLPRPPPTDLQPVTTSRPLASSRRARAALLFPLAPPFLPPRTPCTAALRGPRRRRTEPGGAAPPRREGSAASLRQPGAGSGPLLRRPFPARSLWVGALNFVGVVVFFFPPRCKKVWIDEIFLKPSRLCKVGQFPMGSPVGI